MTQSNTQSPMNQVSIEQTLEHRNGQIIPNIITQDDDKRVSLLDEKVFNVFVRPGEVVEVRIIGANGKSPAWGNQFARGTVSGYFDDFELFRISVDSAIQHQQSNIYFTLQVIDTRLIGRAFNRLKPSIVTTSDSNVTHYRWIPIDIDPKRPSGVSSSESELLKAITMRDLIRDYILMTGDFDHVLTAVSGNGGHILIRIPQDLPVNPENQSFIKNFIAQLSERFSTEMVDVDTTVFNPARIWKLYGTKAMKGDEVPGNQYREALSHRWSFIDDMGGLND
ncbi:MAG: hypothetical protein HQK65_17705 [Desulfamplus sp.]|nr:hypothetical protein [Desulfamplus sp.]